MLQRLILPAVLLCFTFISNAQNYDVSVSKPYPVADGKKFYFNNGQEILAVKITKKRISIQKLSAADLTLLSLKTYEDFPEETTIEYVGDFQDKYYVIYSYEDDGIEKLIAREIDFSSGTFKDKGKAILTIKEDIRGGKTKIVSNFVTHFEFRKKYSIQYSYDKSTFAVFYSLKPVIKDDQNNVLALHIFDKNLVEKSKTTFELPYTERKMDILDYSVDTKGNGYVLEKVYDKNPNREKNRVTEEANYKIEVLKVQGKTGVTSPINVDIKDKFITVLKIFESSKDYMYCAGYYNIGKNEFASDGVVLFKIDDDNKAIDFKTYEFPLTLLNQNANKGEKRKNDRADDKGNAEIKNLMLKYFEIKNDGSLLVIGEESYVEVQTSSNGSISRDIHKDIIVTKIAASAKLDWMTKIPKRQQSISEGGSFNYFAGDGYHYVLFLDSKKNSSLTNDQYPELVEPDKGGIFTIFKLEDKTGKSERISTLDTKDVKGLELFQVSPERILNTSSNTFVFEAYKKQKEDVLIKVQIK